MFQTKQSYPDGGLDLAVLVGDSPSVNLEPLKQDYKACAQFRLPKDFTSGLMVTAVCQDAPLRGRVVEVGPVGPSRQKFPKCLYFLQKHQSEKVGD